MELVLALAALLQDGKGSIQGRVSPEAAVRIVAKFAQTDASKPENVKGEVTLAKGGAFEIKGLPPGKYDLLFQLQGDDKKKFIASTWSEIEVEAGKAVDGIHYRLTPAGAAHLVDELIVSFKADAAPAARAKAIADLGCRVKSKTVGDRFVVVDLPDDRSVAEMAEAFRKLPVVASAEPNGISRIK